MIVPETTKGALVVMRARLNETIKTLHELECTFSTETGQIDLEKMIKLQSSLNSQWELIAQYINTFKGRANE